jgi:glycogen debranching enzyme
MAQTQSSEPARADEVIRVGDHFYVLAVSARADERTRVLKHDDTFGVFGRTGDILSIGLGDHGLYHRGTRHLSRLDLTIDGQRPLLLSSGLDDANLLLAVDVTNPDLTGDGDVQVPRGSVHIHRSLVIWQACLLQQIRIHNFHLHSVRVRLALRFEADFADMFEVRGMKRSKRGHAGEPRSTPSSIALPYEGLDGVHRVTTISFTPNPDVLNPDRAIFDVSLEPHQDAAIDIAIACDQAGAPETRITPFAAAVDGARERRASLSAGECHISTSSIPFNRWLHRSSTDLHLMLSQMPQGLYPYAGIPWFSTPFGRDGIITALETLWTVPGIARGVLAFLSETQATELDPSRDAEPGKIMHEFRQGEMPALGEVPYARYYGSIDSTPLYLVLAGEYLRETGDRAFIDSIRPNIARALEWIDQWGDRDGDGFVEYQAATPTGLNNQGWKDSIDSVFFEDGTIAPAPRSLCEIQGYVYAAHRAAAFIAAAFGDDAIAAEQNARAVTLKSAFNECFWDETLGTYILAICGEKRPCRVAASNSGHCLYTGIALPNHAERIIEDFLSPRFFTGWGVRTLAQGQSRYNPMSYHNGSIWPHDTAIIAAGMARYGHNRSAARLLEAMFDVSMSVELNRLPELFCGFARRPDEGPIRYPVACSPQSWAAGAVFMMLRACLGLEIRADQGQVIFTNPTLPRCLDLVEISNLRVGQSTANLAVERSGHEIRVHTFKRDPGIHILVNP